MTKAQYNYSEIADTICNKVNKHIESFNLKNDVAKAWDLQAQVHKCKLILGELNNKRLISYEKWLLDEFTDTVSKFEVIMKDEKMQDSEFDGHLRRINSLSAVVAYCAQFQLEDCEIFYNIYKQVLEKQNLKLLTQVRDE